MNMKVKLICMAFDGRYVTEGEFDSVEQAWQRSDDMGSRWDFYPFHFVTTASGKTIKDAPGILREFIGKKTSFVEECFGRCSHSEDIQYMGVDEYAQLVSTVI